VNRVWQHLFGKGLVRTPGNFGIAGARPSHPELLDWLTREFIDNGWSTKALHRTIMTSTAYRQSSRLDSEREAADPENTLLSRFPLRRLDAEAIRDSILKVAGRLDTTQFGPADPVSVKASGEVVATATRAFRRSIYLVHRRKSTPTLLEVFDAPRMEPNCLERTKSTVSLQALQLWNSDSARENSRFFADRIFDLVGDDAGAQVDRVYLHAFSRWPSKQESLYATTMLRDLTKLWSDSLKKEGLTLPPLLSPAAKC
jgi:hypothetical protein